MIAAQALGAASGLVPLVIALLFSTVMLTTVVAALREARDEVVLDLAQQISVKELEQLAMQEATDRLRRDVAEYLHGSMQTDLISASLAMQEAVRTRSEVDLRVATDAAIAALSVQYDPHRTVSGQSMVELMANAERRWNGVLGVAWEIEAESIPLAVVPTIASLITEALTNAVVHGAASHATIGIVQSDEHLELRVIDDGIGPQGGVPGLGSALFDDATARHWTIEPGLMGGATMRAVLPI
jgi:signal transduction histidine kinase